MNWVNKSIIAMVILTGCSESFSLIYRLGWLLGSVHAWTVWCLVVVIILSRFQVTAMGRR